MVSTFEDHDEAASLVGEVLASRYRIEERLGHGSTGVVYRARHVKVGRPFAVKLLHAEHVGDEGLRRRFEREAELGGRLRHPNAVGVVDVGELAHGSRVMVMELAQGGDLATLIHREAPLAASRTIGLVRQILDGLHHAHDRGVLHRDLKPENILVERNEDGIEVPRIVDFGIAIARDEARLPSDADRLTTDGIVLGTPHYMAPEQSTGIALDHRVDLFALGIIMFEMVCGEMPFPGSGVQVARANLLEPTPVMGVRVPNLEVDPLLEAFTRSLMAKSPELRPANAKAARELLDRVAHDRVTAAAELGVELGPSLRELAEEISVPRWATPPRGARAVTAPELQPRPSSPAIAALVPATGRLRADLPAHPGRGRSARRRASCARASSPPAISTTTHAVVAPKSSALRIAVVAGATLAIAVAVWLGVRLSHRDDHDAAVASNVVTPAAPVAPVPTPVAAVPTAVVPVPTPVAAAPTAVAPTPVPIAPAQAPVTTVRARRSPPSMQAGPTHPTAMTVSATPPAVTPPPRPPSRPSPRPSTPATTPASTVSRRRIRQAVHGDVGNEARPARQRARRHRDGRSVAALSPHPAQRLRSSANPAARTAAAAELTKLHADIAARR